MTNIHAFNSDNQQEPYTIDREPDVCPQCNRGMSPQQLGQFYVSEKRPPELQRTYRCPIRDCGKLFVAVWSVKGDNPRLATYDGANPKNLTTKNFSGIIVQKSPDFVAIYKESDSAEQRGLKLVCGPGYRKALEYLIKDYLIAEEPKNQSDIEKKMLGQVIQDYVKNENIKAVATRAAWLGNDEVHYKRRWLDKDLTHLKDLIELTIHWIEDVERTKTAIADMQPSGPSATAAPSP